MFYTVIFVIAACILCCDGLKRERVRFHALLAIFRECLVLGKRLKTFDFLNIFCGHIFKGGVCHVINQVIYFELIIL